MRVYTDRTLTCRDCGRSFTFTAGEQEFHASKGFTNDPGRCPDCRAARKAERGSSYHSSGNDYGSRNYSGYSSYDRPRRQMYPAVCAQCGKDTEVPFQPTGTKPVYCSSCFSGARSYR